MSGWLARAMRQVLCGFSVLLMLCGVAQAADVQDKPASAIRNSFGNRDMSGSNR